MRLGLSGSSNSYGDVAIKGLALLDYGDGLSYSLIGHKDPHAHPGSHYYSPAAMIKIINLAHRYRERFNKPAYEANFVVPLLINDSSLIKGGTFDVLQDWTGESNVHGGHRVGIVVDINGIKEESLEFKKFARTCCQIDARWHKRGTAPHYHLLLLGEDK